MSTGRGTDRSLVLVGFESAGKSALFRGLTGCETGDEANFRGSTVVCRSARLAETGWNMVDTPGIREDEDSETTRLALSRLEASDTVLLVARGTGLRRELEGLLERINIGSRRAALAVTFADKAPDDIRRIALHYRQQLGIPAVAIDARNLAAESRSAVLEAIEQSSEVATRTPEPPPPLHLPEPERTILEHPIAGPWISVLIVLAMFGVPVWGAYQLASRLQPLVDAWAIEPAKAALVPVLPSILAAILTGGYGLLTLGWYSFLWAFPVVLFIGIATAIAEETGLNDRMTRSLDPWLRRVGLSGRDLIPVLTGYGCNVVAVFQSRACSLRTRHSCVAMIGLGSACSYQIGASLSIFGSSGRPGLFVPYLLLLFLVGAAHTRLWSGRRTPEGPVLPARHSFLQRPGSRAVWWRIRAVLRQFLLQAMPIFLFICVGAAILAHLGVLDSISARAAPLMRAFNLPGEAAPGVVFSILRKDGLLTLNQGEGSWLRERSAGEAFTLVWLASTLTACLVTLFTVRRELGLRASLVLAARQAVTALVTSAAIGWGCALVAGSSIARILS